MIRRLMASTENVNINNDKNESETAWRQKNDDFMNLMNERMHKESRETFRWT